MFRRRRPTIASGLPENAAVSEPSLDLPTSSTELDSFKARTSARFVLRLDAVDCRNASPVGLLLAVDEGYEGLGGQILSVRIVKPPSADAETEAIR